MFSLSPREDLVLVTTRYNYPSFSWEQITDIILKNYNYHIPPDICCQRYESFLKKINVKNQVISQPAKYQWNNVNQKQITLDEKIPQNFIFAYRQLKSKSTDLNKQIVSLSCLHNYEKKVISKLFGINSDKKSKLIKKIQNSNNTKANIQFVNSIHCLIKQRTEGVLTQEIIEQKIQQILSEIIELVNEKIQRIERDKLQIITNPLDLIRRMKKHFMILERKKIFDIYLQQQEINDINYREIKNILKYIDMTTTYSHQKMQEKLEFIKGQHEKCALSSQNNEMQKIKRGEIIQSVEVEVVKQQKMQPQENNQKKYQIQLFQQINIKKYLQQLVQQCEEEIKIQNKVQDTSNNEINLQINPQIQRLEQSKPQNQINILKPIKQCSLFSNFQVTISNAKAELVNQQQKDEQNQQKIKQQVKQQVKQQQDQVPKSNDNQKRKRQRYRNKHKKIPSTLGKVWLIIND